MEKIEAIGIVEVLYYTTALDILDHMLKSADVKLVHKETALGGKLVTIFVSGSISNVTASIEAAKEAVSENRQDLLKNTVVITNPHREILKYIVSKSQGE